MIDADEDRDEMGRWSRRMQGQAIENRDVDSEPRLSPESQVSAEGGSRTDAGVTL
jgi:hypothetical protein